MARRSIDLDAYRAIRAETVGEPPVATLFGETFELPNELPWIVVEALVLDTVGAFRDAVVALIGADGIARAVAQGATADDFADLIRNVGNTVYGAGNPEALSVSDASSSNGSGRSKPTLPAPTDSTSDDASGDPVPSEPEG